MGNSVTVTCDTLPEGKLSDSINMIIIEKGFSLDKCTRKILPGTKKGDNYGGPIYEIRVEDNETKKMLFCLIAKCSIRGGSMSDFGEHYKFFSREIFSYTVMVPALKDLLTNVQEDIFYLPTLYRSSAVIGDEFLIFEHLREKSFQMANRKTTLNMEHTRLVLKNLGYLHGLGFCFKKKNPLQAEKYKTTLDNLLMDLFLKKQRVFFENLTTSRVEKALKTLDAKNDIAVISRFKTFSKNILEKMDNILDIKENDPYCTFVHGDCWTNNFLFKYEDFHNQEKPTQLCFLDWQLANWSSPVIDLSYFIYLCLGSEIRDAHFDELIQYYYENFSYIIQNNGYDSNELYPFSELNSQIQKYSYYGVVTALHLIPLFTLNSEEVPENVSDVGMNHFVSENENLYVERISAVIRHAVSKNFI